MGFNPLFARVLLEREKAVKSGSIIIPDSASKRHAKAVGRVLAKGPEADDSIEVGAKVIFGMHAGAWLDQNYGFTDAESAAFYIVNDEDILGVVADG